VTTTKQNLRIPTSVLQYLDKVDDGDDDVDEDSREDQTLWQMTEPLREIVAKFPSKDSPQRHHGGSKYPAFRPYYQTTDRDRFSLSKK
jgi:hypothetical protein